MNMNYIWFYPLNILYKLLRSHIRRESVTVKQTSHNTVPYDTTLIAHGDNLRRVSSYTIASSAICDIALPAILHSQLANLLHNTACGGIGTYNRVYL